MLAVILLIFISVSSYIFVGIYRSYAIKKSILDHPNYRSSHIIPIPIGAGVVFPILWTGFVLALHFLNFEVVYLLKFLPSIFAISLVSFLDDRYHLPARYRFLVQIFAVIYSLLILGGFYDINVGVFIIHLGWLGGLLMTIVLLWSINLYNFMDGMDGIAAVEAIFVFGIGGYFIWYAGGEELALVIWAVAVIMLGFLFWNKPPAKIFMGDVGSTFLGFLVAFFAIQGAKKYNVPVLLWVILYGVFWFDATITLLRRFIRGEKWYLGHKLHAFQRLQSIGWSHGKVLLGVIAVNLVLAIFALMAFYFPKYILLSLGLAVVLLTAIYLVIENKQPMYDK